MAVTKMTLRLNEEDTKRLDDLIEKRKYRVSRSEAIRFLIQDTWEVDIGLSRDMEVMGEKK